MRNLGKGQSVVFCVYGEIQTKIASRRPSKDSSHREITVSDVLEWSMSETIQDLRKSMPLWAVQGLRFEKQKDLWDRSRTDTGIELGKKAAEAFLEDEAQSLEHRYRPGIDRDYLPAVGNNARVNRIVARCNEFGTLGFRSATLQEEQERELSPEVEEERLVEKPPDAEPNMHSLDESVREFVRTGVLRTSGLSPTFIPAFQSLGDTGAATNKRILSQFPPDLLVTNDFSRTISTADRGKSRYLDSYKRSAYYILTSPGEVSDDPVHTTTTKSESESGEEPCEQAEQSQTQQTQQSELMIKHMVIISPFEAQRLLPDIRGYKKVTLHQYAPRRNKALRPLDQLSLFNEGRAFSPTQLPRRLRILLNLFAGQLYFDSFVEYKETCELLGLIWRVGQPGVVARADGFIVRRNRNAGSHGSGSGSEVACTFKESPVNCLRALMTSIRRNGEGIDKTHVGDMLSGWVLKEEDFC